MFVTDINLKSNQGSIGNQNDDNTAKMSEDKGEILIEVEQSIATGII